MQKDDGRVEDYDKIPKEEKPPARDDLWSEPFHVGEIVNFKGVRMKIVRVKKLKKQVHLQFEFGPFPLCTAHMNDGKSDESRCKLPAGHDGPHQTSGQLGMEF